MERPKRKPIPIEYYDYSIPGAYFITVCTANRDKIFWNRVGADDIRPYSVNDSWFDETWASKQIGGPIWQKSFYDHGIRNQQDYDEIWRYIENNPLKYALKKAP